MKNIINKSWIAIFVLFIFVLVSGCGDNDKNKKESPVRQLVQTRFSRQFPDLPLPALHRY